MHHLIVRIICIIAFFILFTLLPFISNNAYASQVDAFSAKNSPFEDFASWVSSQTGDNIILGKNVTGNITVHVSSLDKADLLALFKSVADANGYSVESNDHTHKVVEKTAAAPKLEPIQFKQYDFINLRKERAASSLSSILNITAGQETANSSTDEEAPSLTVARHSVVELPSSNALIVAGTEYQIAIIDRYHKEIDSHVPQLLVQAVIMETDEGATKEVGVNLASALSTNGFSFVTTTQNPLNKIADLVNTGEGGHLVFSEGGDIRALIAALHNTKNAKLLSTPELLVMDREEGRLTVGQNVPFLISSESTSNGNIVQEIERKDVGVTLNVTPYVLSRDKVILDIYQESSSVTNSTVASDIITNNRSIKTVATIGSSQSIMLGGLISEEERTTVTGVPLLMDIPWLGNLFKQESKQKVKRKLSTIIKVTLI